MFTYINVGPFADSSLCPSELMKEHKAWTYSHPKHRVLNPIWGWPCDHVTRFLWASSVLVLMILSRGHSFWPRICRPIELLLLISLGIGLPSPGYKPSQGLCASKYHLFWTIYCSCLFPVLTNPLSPLLFYLFLFFLTGSTSVLAQVNFCHITKGDVSYIVKFLVQPGKVGLELQCEGLSVTYCGRGQDPPNVPVTWFNQS
jgi:hypothetical protein